MSHFVRTDRSENKRASICCDLSWQAVVKEAKSELRSQRDYIQSANRDIQQRSKAKAEVIRDVQELNKQLHEQQDAIDKHISESKDALRKVIGA